MSLEEVQKKDFKNSINKLSLGTKAKTTWAKILIKNESAVDKKLFLHDLYAYHIKAVDFYEFIPKFTVYGASAICRFDLPANKTQTLYVKTLSYTHQWFALEIYDEENSKRALLSSDNDIAILFGILFSLAIYNLLIFIVSRTKENIYYSLYPLSASIWLTLYFDTHKLGCTLLFV